MPLNRLQGLGKPKFEVYILTPLCLSLLLKPKPRESTFEMNSNAVRAIVTGAASGLGRAAAHRLVKQGAQVIFDLRGSRHSFWMKDNGNCLGCHP